MDLNAPLGMTPPPRSRRPVLWLAGGITVVVLLGVVAAILAFADPRGGRPFAIASIPPPIAPNQKPLDVTPTGTVPSNAASPQGRAVPPPGAEPPQADRRVGSLEGGVMVFRGGEGRDPSAPAGPLVIDVSRALDDPLGKERGAAVPLASKSEPKLGKPIGSAPPPRPRVALFVSGMGLDAGATRSTIEAMPAAVTLAFLPYGGTVAANVAAAKAKGHEVLLQLPMQNEGGGAPGPHALVADAPPEATAANLAWLMDRASGYDGIVNLLGAPVTADGATMSAVLKAAAARHVFYLDDGTSRRSVAVALAHDANVDAAASDLVLDATSDPAAILANCDRLVALAKRRGSAIGMVSGAPEHLSTIARFAAGLDGKGVTLVPVAALIRGDTPASWPAVAR